MKAQLKSTNPRANCKQVAAHRRLYLPSDSPLQCTYVNLVSTLRLSIWLAMFNIDLLCVCLSCNSVIYVPFAIHITCNTFTQWALPELGDVKTELMLPRESNRNARIRIPAPPSLDPLPTPLLVFRLSDSNILELVRLGKIRHASPCV